MSTKQDARRKEAQKLSKWRSHDSRVGPDAFSHAVGYFGIAVMVGLLAVAICVTLGVSP